jgi:hypothetical protein
MEIMLFLMLISLSTWYVVAAATPPGVLPSSADLWQQQQQLQQQQNGWAGQWNASGAAAAATGGVPPLVKLEGLALTTTGVAHRLWGGVVAPDVLMPGIGSVHNRLWHPNVYLGLEYDTAFRATTKVVVSSGTVLQLRRSVRLGSSQRWVGTTELHTFQLLPQGDIDGHADHGAPRRLRYMLDSGLPNATVVFEFARPTSTMPPDAGTTAVVNATVGTSSGLTQHSDKTGAAAAALSGAFGAALPSVSDSLRRAFYVTLNDTWTISDGGIDNNLLLISLQGLVNRNASRLYLRYPNDWAYSYTAAVLSWVNTTYDDVALTQLSTISAVLQAFTDNIRGFVVFDPAVRPSIAVGLTAAGVLDAVLISPQLVTLLRDRGVPCALDLRGTFDGMTAAQIFSWARDKFFHTCSKHELIWLGGSCGDVLHPAIADWGVSKRAFFSDLDTRPDVPDARAEFELASSLMAELDLSAQSPPLVMGWHSYCKDFEHTFVALSSSHGARVHGLNTNPNLSFMHQLELPRGFEFKNTHHTGTASRSSVDVLKKDSSHTVYTTLVQTDGLGLGAWNKPGRGSLPYSWEVTLPDLELQPALLAMFYSQKTANDTFVAALSGPGYIYPKSCGSHLPRLLDFTRQSMQRLDLQVLVVPL